MTSKTGLFCPESEAPMEKWDLYTRNRELTGREQIRGEAIPEGFYHLVVHVWLKNRRGQYLFKTVGGQANTPHCKECTGGSGFWERQAFMERPGGKRGSRRRSGAGSRRARFSKVRDTAMPIFWMSGFLRKGKMVAFSRTLTERRRRKWRRFTGCGRMRYGGFTTAA